MAMRKVEFQYFTGLKREIFRNPRLHGSWTDKGRYSEESWSDVPMQVVKGEDGCPVFKATVSLDLSDRDKTFKWGVILDGPQGTNFWGIPTEVKDVNSTNRHREFKLNGKAPQVERYYFTYGRRLGANKQYADGNPVPSLRFGVWSPNAKNVKVVFGKAGNGYIGDVGDIDNMSYLHF